MLEFRISHSKHTKKGKYHLSFHSSPNVKERIPNRKNINLQRTFKYILFLAFYKKCFFHSAITHIKLQALSECSSNNTVGHDSELLVNPILTLALSFFLSIGFCCITSVAKKKNLNLSILSKTLPSSAASCGRSSQYCHSAPGAVVHHSTAVHPQTCPHSCTLGSYSRLHRAEHQMKPHSD